MDYDTALRNNLAANGRALVLSVIALSAAFILAGHGEASLLCFSLISGAAALMAAYVADFAALLDRKQVPAVSAAGSAVAAVASWLCFFLGVF